ncbi:MAG: putative rane protein [Solirubrobacterales bacterium]|nr:putative rane protein [Solirubrobacterales bacterium]
MTDTTTASTNGRALGAPVRNRYFYGKLLDVHQLEMEQRYGLEKSRLVNRLTLGSGVLCGLRVRPGGGGQVLVSPGVAVDGLGREIVVTEQVTIDVAALARQEPSPAAAGDALVLCLGYHECDVEPAPVLVVDCDLRQECVPGAVRERFSFTLMDPADAPLPEDPCGVFGAGTTDTTGSSPIMKARLTAALNRLSAEPAVGEETHPGRVGPGAGAGNNLRRQLCETFHPSCGPGSACVPIALLRAGEDRVVVDECLPRRTIYSNAVLLDLILCLAARVDECCNPKVTVTAPKVLDTWPAPEQDVKLAEFETRLHLPAGGFAISFDRELNADRLAAPEEWLRVLLIPVSERHDVFRLPLELDRTDAKTLADGTGQTAYYRVGDGTAADPHAIPALLAKLKAQEALVLVMARSDDVTQIVAADDAELLDADFHGTRLTNEVFDLLWNLAASAASAAIAGALAASLSSPPTPMPQLPSGNGIEGGIFHAAFKITG